MKVIVCHGNHQLSCIREQQIHAVTNDQEQDIVQRWKDRERGGSEGQKEGFWEMGTKGREEKKRRGMPWTATAFRHVTFLFTSGCNTHHSHYWLSLTPFHRHIRAKVAQTRMLTQSHKHAHLTEFCLSCQSAREKFLSSPLSLISSGYFPAELQWWHSWVAEGIQSCPTSLVTQHCCMFPCARETWSQYLGVARTQRSRKYGEDWIWRCVWSVGRHARLSGGWGSG